MSKTVFVCPLVEDIDEMEPPWQIDPCHSCGRSMWVPQHLIEAAYGGDYVIAIVCSDCNNQAREEDHADRT